MKEFLHSDLNDLVLVLGDFNFSEKELDPLVTRPLMKTNPAFATLFSELKVEYQICTQLLSGGSVSCHQVRDLLKDSFGGKYPAHACTFGDYIIDLRGEPVALD